MNKSTSTSTDETPVVEVIRAAGARLLSFWRRNQESLQIVEKGDGSLVTQADFDSNRIIVEGITSLYQNDVIFSEEMIPDFEAIRTAHRTWIIDPLDGTSSFLQGSDDFSILVASCIDLHPTFGIMFFPARDKMITGGTGSRATCNGEVVSVSNISELRPNSVYMRNFEPGELSYQCDPMDSGAALYAVAVGILEGAIIKMVTHRDWDVAAPTAVIRAAGGRVTNESGGEVTFGRVEPDYQYFVASNGIAHEALLALIPK